MNGILAGIPVWRHGRPELPLPHPWCHQSAPELCPHQHHTVPLLHKQGELHISPMQTLWYTDGHQRTHKKGPLCVHQKVTRSFPVIAHGRSRSSWSNTLKAGLRVPLRLTRVLLPLPTSITWNSRSTPMHRARSLSTFSARKSSPRMVRPCTSRPPHLAVHVLCRLCRARVLACGAFLMGEGRWLLAISTTSRLFDRL